MTQCLDDKCVVDVAVAQSLYCSLHNLFFTDASRKSQIYGAFQFFFSCFSVLNVGASLFVMKICIFSH